MTKHVVEQLERRQLLAVTINNGLATTDPNYYEVVVGPGGRPDQIMWENRNVSFDYTALIDVGATSTISGSRVVELTNFGSNPIVGPVAGSAVSTVTLVLDDATPLIATDNPVLTIQVTASVPIGETRLVTSYDFTSVGYDLKTAHFFQYWDCVSGDVTSDFETVQGTIATRNLELRTYNTYSYNYSILEDDVKTPNAILTGFGVGEYPLYKPVIVAGGYIAPATGDFRIPAGNWPGLGPGYGPVPYAVPVLQYGFLNGAAAVVNTSLTQAPALVVPQMQVNWYVGGVEIPIPDGSTLRDPMIGVDFAVFGNTRVYSIRNSGRGDLSLFGNPIVQITGPNADSFHVTRQPMNLVPGGGLTVFFIQYTPTVGGTQTATVSITSNDIATTPYTFQIFGGSGVTITPDAYEDDGPKTIDTAKDWTTQFQKVKQSAKVISTQNVGQTHSIHSLNDVDWVKFYQTTTSPVVIETFAPAGDTRLYLFDSNGKRVTMDDNSGPGASSRISLSSLPAGTYYVRIDESGNNALIPTYTLFVRSGTLAALPPIDGMPPVAGSPSVYVSSSKKLWVWGTDQNDVISVDIANTSLRVVVNSNTWYFPLGEVNSLEIRGECGADSINVGGGVVRSTISGGEGNDTIISASGNDSLIDAGAGDDSVQAGNGKNTIYGGDGNDTITGGSGNDSIEGGAGNNLIHGGGGDDNLKGCDDKDTIYGDAGNDVITGAFSDDSLYGGDGNDTIDAGDGKDYVQSDAGFDQVTTWQDGSVDTILANTTQDLLYVDNDPNDVLDVVINSPI